MRHNSSETCSRLLPQAASEQDVNEKHVDKSSSTTAQKTPQPPQKTTMTEKGEKIKKDLDKIMDEIDDVLEENAEEFIKSYVQRGGE
ncbi:ubiquitin-like protein Pup [candidate division KSB3 bacterium]|uniref:Prokaryotic ubiquitin-like protein Pup n=1 Tax=candidate division KSB3 bacterium TaxID=2044937 RepID=A0A9D5JVL6_9BACT|nr:ubiquitin-like protein Pup [candidate division KSB3 bacterium]MBD3325089.1 ubiquitin-like protein Pup [candidate division KSB3 bacterium]